MVHRPVKKGIANLLMTREECQKVHSTYTALQKLVQAMISNERQSNFTLDSQH